MWRRLRVKAGLPKLRIHDLRHSYASFLVNNGRTLYEVQQILGHSQPIVTQRYAHLSSKSLQQAADSASLAMRGATVPANGPAFDCAAFASACTRDRAPRPSLKSAFIVPGNGSPFTREAASMSSTRWPTRTPIRAGPPATV